MRVLGLGLSLSGAGVFAYSFNYGFWALGAGFRVQAFQFVSRKPETLNPKVSDLGTEVEGFLFWSLTCNPNNLQFYGLYYTY